MDMDFWQGIVSFFYNITIGYIIDSLIWGSLFPINIVFLIGCIYYSLKKRLKTIMIFLVAALLFEIIRVCFLRGIPLLGIKAHGILKIFTDEKDFIIRSGIKCIIGMNSAIVEVVIIIICLISIFPVKILRKSKIIFSSFLLIVLCITIFQWVDLTYSGYYFQGRVLKLSKERYFDVVKKMRQKELKK